MRNYFLSRAPEMDQLLRLTEANEDGPVTCSILYAQTANWLPAARLQFQASELWGFLNLNLTGEARAPFENVKSLEGFEAWRKAIKLVRSRLEVRKMALQGKVRRPAEVKKLADLPMALETWDTHTREFIEAGGRPLSYDEKKMALALILPEQQRADLMIRLHMLPDPTPGTSQQAQDESFNRLRMMLLKQIELTTQMHSMNSRPINFADNGGEEPADTNGDGWGDEPAEDNPTFELYQMACQAFAV